jgi:tetratricopeptide (TPR) repeat protein
MDCRTSALAVLALSWSCCGCVMTQSTTSPVGAGTVVDPSVAKPTPPKTPGLRLAMAYGEVKEKQALEPARTPEDQVKLRDEARVAYQEALRLDPNNLNAYRALGRVYTQADHYEQALETYKKGLAHQPKSVELWLEMGQCHNRKKDWPEALVCFQKALELEPESRKVLTALGLTLARTGQVEQSLVYLTRASSSAIAHYNLARMQVHLNQPEQARVHLAVALRENPNFADARELQARLDRGPTAAVSTATNASN